MAQPDWATIRYMVATIQYGGRITDDFDRVLLETYAEKFYHQARAGCCRGVGWGSSGADI